MTCERAAVLCVGLAVIASAEVANAQSATQALWVQDVPLYDHASWYRRPAADAPAPLPFPPLDQIPPVAMPDPELCISDPLGPTSLVFHDAKTGFTLELPDAWGLKGAGSIRGFRGSDGGDGREYEGRTFDDRTEVVDTGAFPYRMNAKAVMRKGIAFSTCSASLIDAEVALLAGHCVYSQDTGYYDEIYIIPGWDGEGQHVPPPPDDVLNPFGWASGTQYLVGADWVSDGNYDRDMGVVVLTRAAGMLTGWFGHAWGGTCPDIQAKTYYNASYPALPGNCYDGTEMWIWHGTFDDCPGNQLEIFTTAGCHSEVQNGMSGSSAYYVVEAERYAHAVCSNHFGSSAGRFCKMWQGFNTLLAPFINDTARGAVLDIQPLDCNGPASALPGNVVVLNHLCTNPTNFDPPQQSYTFTWYLSGDEHITTADTPLSTRSVQLNLGSLALDPAGAMARVVTMPPVQIPANTPPGTYWLGVIYDPATDSVPGNNAATTWDAHQILISSSSP